MTHLLKNVSDSNLTPPSFSNCSQPTAEGQGNTNVFNRFRSALSIVSRNCKKMRRVLRPEPEFPHVEWTPDSKFSFFNPAAGGVDVVGDEKRELKCIANRRCTVFSSEVFDIKTADFEETVYFPGGTLGGNVCFGLVGENPTFEASNFLCGEAEIKSSIGLLLRPDFAAVLYQDEVRDVEKSPTTQDTSITIRVKNGNLTFDVDKRGFSSRALRSLNKQSTESRNSSSSFTYDASDEEHLLVEGKFRLAVSLSYQGQVATFDPERGRSRNAGAPVIPQAIWQPGGFFTFHGYQGSIDVVGNKRELVCNGGDKGQFRRATCFSKQIFDLEFSKFSETITFHGGLCGGELAVGILGAEPCAHQVSEHVCGDVEIADSVGVFISADGVGLRHKGTVTDRKLLPPSKDNNGDIAVKLEVDCGKIVFTVNDWNFSSPLLDSLVRAKTFAEHSKCKSKYRLGISMTSAGQRATLFGGDVPHREWMDRNPFTFHAPIESISLIDSGMGALCVADGRATVYSNEIFDVRSVSFARTFTLYGGTRGGDVSFGFVNETPSLLVNNHICGEVELQNSISFLLRPDRAGILHRNDVIDSDVVDNEDKEVVTVTLSCNHGRLSFQLNDKDHSAPYLGNLGLEGKFRLAISLTREGQRVTVSDPTFVTKIPEVFFVGHSVSSINNNRIHLETMSTSASTSKSGIAAWCTESSRSTVFSREVFDLAETPVSLSVVIEGGLHQGDVCIGFCGVHQTKAIASHLCGEIEVLNSAGFLARPTRNCMLHADTISDSEPAVDRDEESVKDIVVRVNLSHGRMSVMVNDRYFHMPSFDSINLSGMGRLAISMTKRGQKVYLAYDGVTTFEAAGGGYVAEAGNRALVDRDGENAARDNLDSFKEAREVELAELLFQLREKLSFEQNDAESVVQLFVEGGEQYKYPPDVNTKLRNDDTRHRQNHNNVSTSSSSSSESRSATSSLAATFAEHNITTVTTTTTTASDATDDDRCPTSQRRLSALKSGFSDSD